MIKVNTPGVEAREGENVSRVAETANMGAKAREGRDHHENTY